MKLMCLELLLKMDAFQFTPAHKNISCLCFKHCFFTHMLRWNVNFIGIHWNHTHAHTLFTVPLCSFYSSPNFQSPSSVFHWRAFTFRHLFTWLKKKNTPHNNTVVPVVHAEWISMDCTCVKKALCKSFSVISTTILNYITFSLLVNYRLFASCQLGRSSKDKTKLDCCTE